LKEISASTQNQALNALPLVSRPALGINIEDQIHSIRARQKRRLPVVLTVKEVKNFQIYRMSDAKYPVAS